MNSPRKNSSVKWSKCLSGWNSHCVWVRTLSVSCFLHCGSARRASMKRNTSSVVGFIVVALYITSNTCHNCCSKENFKVVRVVQQTLGNKSFLEDSLISCGKWPCEGTKFEVSLWRHFRSFASQLPEQGPVMAAAKSQQKPSEKSDF